VNNAKHVVVGLFVIVGLVLLGTMIVWFEGVSFLVRGGYTVTAHMEDGMGIRDGKRVNLDGIEVGEVRAVATSQPERQGVWITILIKKEITIPANSTFIAQQTTIGDVYLNFQTKGKREGALPMDGTARVEGISKTPSILPEGLMTDFQNAMGQLNGLGPLVANLTELTKQRTLKDVAAGQPKNLWTTLEQFDLTARALQDVFVDPKSDLNQLLVTARTSVDELRKTMVKAATTFDGANKSLAGFDEASAKAGNLMDKGTVLAEKLTKDSERLGLLVDNLNGMVADLRAGKGTMGKLFASDELHRALVTLTENLRTMTDNTNRLVTMWREEGVFSKEKK
jgi:phospholipid/cholesterol/gamma-HCH transport system substrate-binding protein